MITRRENKVTVNGIHRLIDIKELYNLSRKYLSDNMSLREKDQFVDEVIFRISDLEFDANLLNGKTVEEYYFAACLAYAEENGFQQFLDEEDDGNIFEYCGSKLIKNGDFKAVLV